MRPSAAPTPWSARGPTAPRFVATPRCGGLGTGGNRGACAARRTARWDGHRGIGPAAPWASAIRPAAFAGSRAVRVAPSKALAPAGPGPSLANGAVGGVAEGRGPARQGWGILRYQETGPTPSHRPDSITARGSRPALQARQAGPHGPCGHGPGGQAVAPEGADAPAWTPPPSQGLPMARSWCRTGAGARRGSWPAALPLRPAEPRPALQAAPVASARRAPPT